MKHIALLVLAFCLFHPGLSAQGKKPKIQASQDRYPQTFNINRVDFDRLFACKVNEVVKTPGNKYLNGSVLQLNSLNGDMRLLRVKLSYFPKAMLMVQVNGEYSTQVFILSDNKTMAYKGLVEKDRVIMTKCNKDEIVSE